MKNIIIESCVDSLEKSLNSIKNGANRLEYCTSLDQDGLTPTLLAIETLLKKTNIPIRIMIRPSNTFYISECEMKIMTQSINEFKELPIDGFVLGMLNKNNRIDLKQLEQLVLVSGKIPITFHKAIDASSNILEDLSLLNQFSQIDHILSSGGQNTAWEGKDMLIKMNEVFENEIIAAGNITSYNLLKHQEYLQLSAYHGKIIV